MLEPKYKLLKHISKTVIDKSCHKTLPDKLPGPKANPIACQIAMSAKAFVLSFSVVDWDKTARQTATLPTKRFN